MKQRHSSKILNFAKGFSSRESAFILAVIGVIVQTFHTYFITYSLSSYNGGWRIFQAILMAFFLSGALLYFTLKSTDGESKTAKRYRKLVLTFAILESVINLWYWGNRLLIEMWPTPDYASFIICIPFSIFLPFILKNYSNEVRVDDYSEEIDIKTTPIEETNNIGDIATKTIMESIISDSELKRIQEEIYIKEADSDSIKEFIKHDWKIFSDEMINRKDEETEEIEQEVDTTTIGESNNIETPISEEIEQEVDIVTIGESNNIETHISEEIVDTTIGSSDNLESIISEESNIDKMIVDTSTEETVNEIPIYTIGDNYIIDTSTEEIDEEVDIVTIRDSNMIDESTEDLEFVPEITEQKEEPSIMEQLFQYNLNTNGHYESDEETTKPKITPIAQPSQVTSNGVRTGMVNYY